ncbi:MAG: histidine--tRNA ligase [Candidatus Aegiribacteria sp.]
MSLSRKPLKGMRQLMPGEKRVEDYITGKLADAGRLYGFEEYEAPVLEPLELFAAKSGSELAAEQSYNFIDKGGRELIMRPELTPSLARMVASSGELIYPVRWMSFPVCYRYENPQRGRVREFTQFNLDILGVDGLEAELDVLLVLRRVMNGLGASAEQYEIRYSSRKLASAVLESLGLDPEQTALAYSIIDKRDRMKAGDWEEWARTQMDDPSLAESVIAFASCSRLDSPWLLENAGETEAYREIREFSLMLERAGVSEAAFQACVVRGLDYYTGIVFEVMDTGGKNRRALCGGGRYDDLVGLFGGQRVSGVGFGLGLLTLQLFLETYGLIPESIPLSHPADLFLAVYSGDQRDFALGLAEDLRDRGVAVELDITGRNLSRQLKTAHRKSVRFASVIGPDEAASGKLKVREMSTGEETPCMVSEAADVLAGLKRPGKE